MHSGNNQCVGNNCIALYTNISSLNNKLDELKQQILELSPSLIILVETWLNKDYSNNEISIQGYNLIRKDREHKRGGGIAIYISQGISYEEFNLGSLYAEVVWFDIIIKKIKWLFGVYYRPPKNQGIQDNNLLDSFLKGLSFFKKGGFDDIFILGDFNLPKINWVIENHSYSDNSFAEKFIRIIDNHLLIYNDTGCTRFRGTSKSTLDLVFNTKPNNILGITTLSPIGKSDHVVLKIDFNVSNTSVNSFENDYLDFKGIDYKKINTSLQNIDIDTLFNKSDEIESDFNTCFMQVSKIIKTHTKIKSKTKVKIIKKKWITGPLLLEIRKRNKFFKMYIKTNTSTNYIRFKKQRNFVNYLRVKNRKTFELDLLYKSQKENKILFNYIKNNRDNSTSELDYIILNDKKISDPKLIAEAFNNHFAKLNSTYNCSFPILSDLKDIVVPSINEKQIYSIITNAKDSLSYGIDEIPFFLIKRCIVFFTTFLTKFLNLAFKFGFVPDIWKISKIWPKFKKGNTHLLESYRPISIVSSLAKITEKLILLHINSHIESNQLLPTYQHGFRSNLSTSTNLLEFNKHVITNFEQSKNTDVIFLDFSAAFDSVNHCILIGKLINLHFPKFIVLWIHNFIRFRVVITTVNLCSSDKKRLSCGVPQGAVLSATLFSLYLYDLPLLSSKILLYADDVKIFREVSDSLDNKALQNDLDLLLYWSHHNALILNPNKSSVLHLGLKNKKFPYILDSQKLTVTVSQKDLGIFIDCNYDFSDQINHIVKQLKSRYGFIRNNFKFISKQAFEIIYKAFLQPFIDYCSPCFGTLYTKDTNRLNLIFRKFTKSIHGFYNFSYEIRLSKLNILPPTKRIIYNDMIFMFREIIVKNNINKYFSLNVRTSKRSHKFAIVKPLMRSKKGTKSVFFRSIDNWNKLPNEAFITPSLFSFKKKLFSFLKDL